MVAMNGLENHDVALYVEVDLMFHPVGLSSGRRQMVAILLLYTVTLALEVGAEIRGKATLHMGTEKV